MAIQPDERISAKTNLSLQSSIGKIPIFNWWTIRGADVKISTISMDQSEKYSIVKSRQ